MSHIIGITGGVGAGKSTILNLLQNEYQAYLIIADDVTKRLYNPGESAYSVLRTIFGDSILLPETGEIDRKKMAEIIFSNQALLEMVNDCVHPLTIAAISSEIQKASLTNDYIVVEAALLTKGALDAWCDEIWYVYVPEEERIRRLQENRGYTREKCESIMASQATDEQYREFSQYVIDNSRTKEEVAELVRERILEISHRGS